MQTKDGDNNMKSETLYFVKDSNFREVYVYDDGTYRISGRNGTRGKLHENLTEYISDMIRKGWKKCDLTEYVLTKHGRNDLYERLKALRERAGENR